MVYDTGRLVRREAHVGRVCSVPPKGLLTERPHNAAMQELSRTTTGASEAPAGRIVELDGLRGCACLLVVIGHYFGEVAHGARFLRLEWVGVDLFFCLSGFLIGGILLDNRESRSYWATFYIRRGFRIFPIYYLTVTLVLLALPHFAGLVEPAYSAGVYYSYAQNILMSLTGVETSTWLTPTWTLCVEEQFYLLLPLIIFLAPPRWLARILVLLIASASLFRLGLVLLLANKLAFFMLLPTEWDLLFLGVVGASVRRMPALWSRLQDNDRRGLQIITFAGLVTVLLLAIADNALGVRSFDVVGRLALGLALTGLVLLLVSGSPEGVRFRSPVLRLFGVISYGLYLIHQPVAGILHGLILGGRPDIGTVPQLAVTIGAFGLSVGLAYLSWTYFESPLVHLGHHWRYSTSRRLGGERLRA
jgi:peptidoglycan/LPS O-acetylase OafA/YrhL